MEIREFQPEDSGELIQLFCDTVYLVNAKDYTKEQLDAWTSGCAYAEKWIGPFLLHTTLVAVDGKTIVGFGDIDDDGYLDHLFVHHHYQGRGIGTLICDELEKRCLTKIITTHSSITAKPFFERRGYFVVREQQVVRNGVLLTNYVMTKYRMDVRRSTLSRILCK